MIAAAEHDPPGRAVPFRPAAFGRRWAKCVSALRNLGQNSLARRGEFGNRQQRSVRSALPEQVKVIHL
jgi:hypothetical protein